MNLIEETVSMSHAGSSIAQQVVVVGGYPLVDQRNISSRQSMWYSEVEPSNITHLVQRYDDTISEIEGKKFLVGYRASGNDVIEFPFLATVLDTEGRAQSGGKWFSLERPGVTSGANDPIFTNDIILPTYTPEPLKVYSWPSVGGMVQVTSVNDEGVYFRHVHDGSVTRIYNRSGSEITFQRFASMSMSQPMLEVSPEKMTTPVFVPREEGHRVLDEAVIRYMADTRVPLNEVVSHKEYLVKGVGRNEEQARKWYVTVLDSDGEAASSREVIQVNENGVILADSRGGWVPPFAIYGGHTLADAPLEVFELNPNLHRILDGYHDLPNRNCIISTRAAHERVTKIAEMHDELNDALNEEADAQGWCPEFEDSVMPVGFTGRESQSEVDWDVEVSYSASGTDDREVSASTAEGIASDLGIEGHISTVTLNSYSFTGTVTVSVTARRNASNSELEELIETWQVRDAIDALVDIEVDDWNVVDSEIDE